MSERFTVEVDIRAKDSTGSALKGAKSGFNEAFSEIASGALRRAGEGLTDFAKQIPGMIVDLGKLGVEVQTNQRRFEKFAGGTARAEMFLEAFNEGTGNTVDRMAAMSSSARLLQMGLVTTGDEMSQIASMATKLGDQTMGAGDRIADFAALLANQSTPRLDNFGISSGRVKLRIDELLASGQALNREQAFKMAVMEEGAKSLDTLGDVSDLTSVKMEILAASLQTAKQGFAEIIAEDIAGLAGDIEKTGEAVRDLPTRFRDWREAIQGTTFAHRANNEEIQAAQEATRKQREETENASAATRAMMIDLVTGTESHRQYADAMDTSNAGLDQLAISSAQYQQEQRNLVLSAQAVTWETHQYAAALNSQEEEARRSEQTFGDLDKAIIKSAANQDKLKEAALDMEEAFVQSQRALSRSLFSQLGERESTTAKFNEDRKEEEKRHLGEMEELRKRGASTSIQIDEEAEQAKLGKLQERLQLAVIEEDAFTDKTKEATKLRKEFQIRDLKAGIAEQELLLANHRSGRLVKAGENVSGLITEENRLHQSRMTAIQEEMEQEKEARRQEIGAAVGAAAISELDKALSDDKITLDEYSTAVDEVQLSLGLTDQASINMSKAVLRVVENLANGTLAVSGFNEALEAQTVIYSTELLQTEKFGGLLSDLFDPAVAATAEEYALTEQTRLLGGAMLVSEEKVVNMKDELNIFKESSEFARDKAADLASAILAIPDKKEIEIITKFTTIGKPPREQGLPSNVPADLGLQGGTAFAGGGLSMVGEQGPELAFVPRGASVFPADQSRHISNNFNLSVNSPSSSMGVQNEFAMMQSLAA